MTIQRYWNYAATVIKVVDGDTIDFDVDLGFTVHVNIRTRVLGIDTPEVSTVEGRACRDYVRSLLPPGTKVMITTTKAPGDKYGRWLAKVELRMTADAEPIDLAEHLIEIGFGQEYWGGAKAVAS